MWGKKKRASADGNGDKNLADIAAEDRDHVTEAAVTEPDTVEAVFGKAYPKDIVDEVRSYEKPPWQEEESSLDPIEDMEEYWRHDFALPPDVYEAVQHVAEQRAADLDALRDPPDEEYAGRVRTRQKLVEVRDSAHLFIACM